MVPIDRLPKIGQKMLKCSLVKDKHYTSVGKAHTKQVNVKALSQNSNKTIAYKTQDGGSNVRIKN